MMRALAPFALLFTVACEGGADAEAACEAYLDAAVACLNTAYDGDDAGAATAEAALDGACVGQAELTGDAAQTSVDLFDCYTETYEAADCSTVEGYAAATTDILSCI